MNTLTTQRRHHDRGASLAEILVTVFLLGIVGTILTGTIISAMKTTRSTQSGVEGQSELNDALARIARDITVADPIIATTTTLWGGNENTPSTTDLWVQSVMKYNCVRTRYYLEDTGTELALKSATQTFAGDTCPDPTQPISTPTPVVKTIIRNFKDTNATGNAIVPLFTYYDKNNNTIPAPVARANTAKIARVKIDVGSNVRERSNGVRLSTSATPRSLDGSLVTGIPAPACISYASTDTTSGIIGADLTGAQTADYVPSPVVRWHLADYGDTYTLRRRNLDGTWTTLPYTTSGTNMEAIDTALRGHHSRSFSYQLDITGPGGSTTCDLTVAPITAKPPAAPDLTVTITPDTSTDPYPGDFTRSDAQLSWPTVPEVEQYQIQNRPIDANTDPFSATGTGNWTNWSTPVMAPATTRTAGMFFNSALEWRIIATDTDWTAPDGTVGTQSNPSNAAKTLAHNNAPLIGSVVANNASTTQTGPVTYNQNRITWTAPGDTTIDGYRVWKRVNGTTTWQAASPNLPATDRTFLDTGVPLSSTYDYKVTAYNQGPRGTGATNPNAYPGTGPGTIYYGRNSNVVTILQYPNDPAYYAHGTEWNSSTGAQWNPDGRNSVHWPAVPTATNYKIDEYNTAAQVTGFTFLSATTTATNFYSTDRTPRGSRQFYVVSAQNATGWSPNTADNTLRTANVAIAYQRPSTPSLTWAKGPDLNVDPAVGNATVFNYTRNADDGETSEDKYCADSSKCWYYAYKGNAVQETEYGNTGDGIIGGNGRTEWWGTTDNWGVFSCNPGGCSDGSYVTVNYYPGPFVPKPAVFGDYRSLDQWGKSGSYTRLWSGDGGANFNWTRSYGATWWDIKRTPVADDSFNYSGSQWYNQSGAYNNHAPGWTRTDTTNTTGTNQQLQDASGNPMRPWGTPGSVQRFAVTAVAANGYGRYEFVDYQQKAAPVKFAETARACNGSNTTRWRLAGRVQPQAALYDSVTGNVRHTYTDHFRITTVAGRQSGTGSAFTQLAADLENNTVDGTLKGTPSAAGDGTQSFADGAWNLDGNQDLFWMHEGISNGAWGTANLVGGIFSVANANWNAPRQSYVGGAMRVTPILMATGAHAVGEGDFGGVSISLNEFVVNDQSFACSQSGNWFAEVGSISRSGVIGGGSTIAPSGAGATFGLSGN